MTHVQARHPLVWEGQPSRAREVPDAVLRRLPGYLSAIEKLAADGRETVSSETLASLSGVNSATLRKDLANLGSNGTRGVGYGVAVLASTISAFLGLDDHSRVVILGAGHLGTALAGYPGFADRGFEVAAVLDIAENVVGTRVGPHLVEHVDELPRIVAERHARMAVIAVPAEAAVDACRLAVESGVSGILNFAPVVVSVPEPVKLRQVDLATELQILAFRAGQQTAAPALAAKGAS